MKERGIIFSGDNPKLILEGRKTQTRRIVTDKRLSPKLTLIELFDFLGGGGACEGTGSQSDDEGLRVSFVSDYERQDDDGRRYKYTGLLVQSEAVPEDGAEEIVCPYGVAGDRFWVRETHYRFGRYVLKDVLDKTGNKMISVWHFQIDRLHANRVCFEPPKVKPSKTSKGWHKRPSIFMPKWAARIWREITKVRIERLQDISEEDAKAEGMVRPESNPFSSQSIGAWADAHPFKYAYSLLWDSLHGKGAWDKNPWVRVLEFKKL